ncbi:MAG: ATP-binding protein [Dehalococcoidia bacterium]|jgi:hypothetical protein
MATHESGVNFQNLIKDLAEMYPFEVAEVVLVELIANALDAKPTRISIDYSKKEKILVVTDNGEGMTLESFDQYHDFAAGLKTRGTGIGFAGIGAKVSFNIATRVLTETCSDSFRGGSEWQLQTKNKLVWQDIKPKYLKGKGTRVEIHFKQDATITYSTTKELKSVLQRQYLPLLNSEFLNLYSRINYYSKDLRFIINDEVIEPTRLEEAFQLEKVRKFKPQRSGKGIGYGVLGLAGDPYPIAPDICGVFLCTHGKVIKADLFNQFPGTLGPQILGVVEIPEFVKFLTTSKTDFIRRGKHADFEKLYDPIRQEFKTWLGELGVQSSDIYDPGEVTKLERELKKIIEDVPELSELLGFRMRKDVLHHDLGGEISAQTHEGVAATFPDGEGKAGTGTGLQDIGDQPGESLIEDKESGTESAKPISRTSRRGPKVTFSEVPERVDLAWVDGNNVVINIGHPCYKKVHANSTAKRLHYLFSIAIAVQRFIASGSDTQEFIFADKMMSAWGNV